jgi:branched-chain amino acid aminotransferase
MLLPMDDHGFHRGDAVFEAARLHSGAYFDLKAHLLRLRNSAAKIEMQLPKSIEEISAICVELARRCSVPNAILRLYVTRGPGGFSPSPSEVTGHQIYAALTKIKSPTPEQYSGGVTAMLSTVEAKSPSWAQIKSCNYLQNVLMKQECNRKGMDFAISVDHTGRVCEGATENLMIVGADNEIKVPRFDYTLKGTTVSLVMKLAEELVTTNQVRGVRMADLTVDDLLKAREMAFVGTTLGVLPVRELDGQKIGEGRGGRICQILQSALTQQMQTNSELRTTF